MKNFKFYREKIKTLGIVLVLIDSIGCYIISKDIGNTFLMFIVSSIMCSLIFAMDSVHSCRYKRLFDHVRRVRREGNADKK